MRQYIVKHRHDTTYKITRPTWPSAAGCRVAFESELDKQTVTITCPEQETTVVISHDIDSGYINIKGHNYTRSSVGINPDETVTEALIKQLFKIVDEMSDLYDKKLDYRTRSKENFKTAMGVLIATS